MHHVHQGTMRVVRVGIDRHPRCHTMVVHDAKDGDDGVEPEWWQGDVTLSGQEDQGTVLLIERNACQLAKTCERSSGAVQVDAANGVWSSRGKIGSAGIAREECGLVLGQWEALRTAHAAGDDLTLPCLAVRPGDDRV